MKNSRLLYWTLLLLSTLWIQWGCSTSKNVTAPVPPPPPPVPVEEVTLPEMKVSPVSEAPIPDSLPIYNASEQKSFDLLHTKLAVSFDWKKKYVLGNATLTLKPWFKQQNQLKLDAKGFDIHSVKLNGKTLSYQYDSLKLNIQLDRTYSKTDSFNIEIVYTAKPDERSGISGSAAITQDKGLYFINPNNEISGKPRQIWTQGETESNSCWFPTIDKPNERCTQETYITVEDHFATLSNGKLVSQVKNADGTRTDYWKMDKPHAPYLFMMAIGDFAVVKEKWNDVDLSYYVEPEFEAEATDIFPYTKEMLTFFSEKLGVKYPWSKLGQVVVRDYVSGAMENTTAIIYGEYVQLHKADLIDQRSNELVVAHEIFHHWFGDLVTCESWANLTLNEGFANFSEYLWLEHKYGPEEAEIHRETEWNGYLGSLISGMHNLIHYRYDNREAMFDAHSYNKGGLVLRYLRSYLGDAVFFESLKYYLTKHAFTDVEVDELRMAFEEVSGEDLNWFFNQWYHASGHPSIKVENYWNDATKQLTVNLEQTQDVTQGQLPIFELPMKIQLFTPSSKTPKTFEIRMNKRKQDFVFDVAEKPIWVNVDADKNIPAEWNYTKSPETLLFQLQNGPKYIDRSEAMDALAELNDTDIQKVLNIAVNDKNWNIRMKAIIKAASLQQKLINHESIKKIATSGENANERAAAISYLSTFMDSTDKNACIQIINGRNRSNSEIFEAFNYLNQLDPAATKQVIPALVASKNENLWTAVGEYYLKHEPGNTAFFEEKIPQMKSIAATQLSMMYVKSLIDKGDSEDIKKGMNFLKRIAINDKAPIESKVSGAFSIKYLISGLEASGNDSYKTMIEEAKMLLKIIKDNEKDENIKQLYEMQGF